MIYLKNFLAFTNENFLDFFSHYLRPHVLQFEGQQFERPLPDDFVTIADLREKASQRPYNTNIKKSGPQIAIRWLFLLTRGINLE